MKNNLNLIKVIKYKNNYIDIVVTIPQIVMCIYDTNIKYSFIVANMYKNEVLQK